jgi:uncharacterized protein (DUF697 family)
MSKNKKTLTRIEQGDEIIRNHTGWAVAAGLIPVPLADYFAVSGIQLDMLRKLSELYQVDFSEDKGKASIAMLAGAGFARMFTGFAKAIPGVGTLIGGVSTAVASGASTYALGEVFQRHYEGGGTLLEGTDVNVIKTWYQEALNRGKELATSLCALRKKSVSEDDLSKEEALENLNDLRENGFVTAEEFEKMKKRIMAV